MKKLLVLLLTFLLGVACTATESNSGVRNEPEVKKMSPQEITFYHKWIEFDPLSAFFGFDGVFIGDPLERLKRLPPDRYKISIKSEDSPTTWVDVADGQDYRGKVSCLAGGGSIYFMLYIRQYDANETSEFNRDAEACTFKFKSYPMEWHRTDQTVKGSFQYNGRGWSKIISLDISTTERRISESIMDSRYDMSKLPTTRRSN